MFIFLMVNFRCKVWGWRVGSVIFIFLVRVWGSLLVRMWEGVVGMVVFYG